MACVISKTTNVTSKILAKMNREMGDLRTAVLQTGATINSLLLKRNLGYQPFPGSRQIPCLSVSDSSHTIDGQIGDLHQEIHRQNLSSDF